jgi:hypothetical protein
MAIKSLKHSSGADNVFYRTLLAGNIRSTITSFTYNLLGNPSFATGAFNTVTHDTTPFAGMSGALVVKFVNPLNSFEQDVQFDNFTVGGNNYGFETSEDGFRTSTGQDQSFDIYSFAASTGANGDFNRTTGDTTSTGTGTLAPIDGSSYYLYTETSSPASVAGWTFWLLSPFVTMTNSISFDVGLATGDAGDLTIEYALVTQD